MNDLSLMIVDETTDEENIDVPIQNTTNITVSNDFSNVTSISNATTSGNDSILYFTIHYKSVVINA